MAVASGQELALDAAASAAPPALVGARERTFRPDIEGLRAVAVIAVMAFHAGVPGVGGGYVGVDVFFVLSGFLITGLLVDERVRRRSISLRRFYGRRARRLLPASTLVVLAVLAGAYLLGGPLQLHQTAADARSVATFSVNFRFAGQLTGYFAPISRPSPFQHFWSLAVEEQFYFVWPALLLLLAIGTTTARAVQRRVVGFLVVLVPVSFAWCVYQTQVSQPHAFFLLPSRAWELGIGALIALVPLGALRRRTTAALSVAGTVLVLGACALLRDTGGFPGWEVGIPVLGTAALVVVGGSAPGSFVPRVLSWSPLQRIGRYSYSLYLWHWALLVVVAMAKPRVLSSWPKGTAVVAVSVVPAILAFHLLEDPVRRSLWLAKVPRRSLVLGVSLLATSLVAALLGFFGPSFSTGTAAALGSGLTPTDYVPRNVTPSILHAAADGSPLWSDRTCDTDLATPQDRPCSYGDAHADRTVVLLGDSHAGMWFPAVRRFAASHGWRLEVDVTGGCTMLSYDDGARCNEHRDLVLDRLARQRPALVVLVDYGRLSLDRGQTEASWRAATATTLRRLSGSHVLLFGESPRPNGAADSCLAKHLADVRPCEPSVHDGQYRRFVDGGRAAATAAGAGFVDLAPIMCTATRCPVVDGNVLVFHDENHVTNTFEQRVEPDVVRAMDAALTGA